MQVVEGIREDTNHVKIAQTNSVASSARQKSLKGWPTVRTVGQIVEEENIEQVHMDLSKLVHLTIC